MSDYYQRQPNSYGGWANDDDMAAQRQAMALMAKAWDCDVHDYGRWAPVDCWMDRDGQILAVAEIKHRDCQRLDYPMVWLNMRKWWALTQLGWAMCARALYVYRWRDATGWLNVADVDTSKVVKGGTRQVVKGASDVEPVILIPVSAFQLFADGVAT